ncbi:hypothetical protein ACSDQ9_07070 [Aestuariimicrobium soli]|uniref:hypothetical protein n=1 Tax=Aestuariimicrobium soli TaxID=2035834 RepID=UPI003EBB25C1
MSGQQLVDLAADVAGVKPRRVWSLPIWLLTALGVAMPGMRELAETGHMFTQPFVMDSRDSQQRLGLDPTPLDEGLRATLAWWRAELSR